MPKHIRGVTLIMLTGLTAFTGAGPSFGAGFAPSAGVASSQRPGFLSASDLPPRPGSSWTSGKITAGTSTGVETDRCLGMALDGVSNSWHRDFRTDLDTSARQVGVQSSSASAAKSLYSRINQDIKSCAGRIERADPQTEATLRDYGRLDVEEGSHVYGLHTETSWGATDIRLLSVGRDGTRVTVVDWGQMGGFADAPVKAFKKTTVKAVDGLR
ncbi:hypothetical protein GCM10010269_04950 [Streptomyces humidus]|uniref:PknH-like extracellular domain-containing protein n=1 Tax=Streptomyces humidus TaxID=52259 RepID=A0A918L1F2_9ACTN|nr:hypothetical protein [Streptomyces humidus]GGR69204.1 hypothetical protein GCM10010269_04950 [Streptomyces humidus]